MYLVTKEQLRAMIPHASKGSIDTFYEPLCKAMEKYEINTPLRIAAFIAQVTHESGSLRYVEELASGSAYEHRKDLGNLEREALDAAHANHATSGRFYKGHGLIQITGYYNHRLCGKALRIDLISKPKLLCEPEYATLSAAWFWGTHNCNYYASIPDFRRVTKIINGGYNGLEDRLVNYTLCKKVLGIST